ncbi:MAG TPA: hypothetical protein PKA88_10425 [Polyangiaceae bacterium]|nr:hypothetical protein [Polyangiaceae bacterium]
MLLGIPFASDGFQLAGVRLDCPDRLVLRYDATDAVGHVRVIALPPGSLERTVARLRHVALYYEAALPTRDLELRAKAAELLEHVGACMDAWLDRAPDLKFPHGLVPLPAQEKVPFDVGGLHQVLADISAAELPLGSSIVDVFPTASGLNIEFGTDESTCRVVLTIDTAQTHRAMMRGKRLSMSVQQLGPEADVSRAELTALSELCALALVIREESFTLATPSTGSWQRPWSATERPPATAAAEDPALAREVQLLQPTLTAASRYFGASCQAEWFAAPTTALRIRMAPIPAELATGPSYFLDAPEAFRRRRELAVYLRALGYFLDEDGLMRTVPSPETLHRLLSKMGVAGGGFRARLIEVDDYRVDPVSWLSFYLEGTIGINVATERFYQNNARKLALHMPNRFWCEHMTAVAHDMSVHVLLTHRIPFSHIAEMAALAEPVWRRCRAEARPEALTPLVDFYEGDLPQICREVWERLSTPEDFDRAFSARRSELLARLRASNERCQLALAAPDTATLSTWKRRAELSRSVAEDIWRAARSGLRRSRSGEP